MASVACRNEQCPEYGLAKDLAIDLAPGEVIRCGGLIPGIGPCGTECAPAGAEASPA